MKFSKSMLAATGVGLALVTYLALSLFTGERIASPQEVAALFREAETTPTARLILSEGLSGNPIPSVSQIEQLRKKVHAEIQRNH